MFLIKSQVRPTLGINMLLMLSYVYSSLIVEKGSRDTPYGAIRDPIGVRGDGLDSNIYQELRRTGAGLSSRPRHSRSFTKYQPLALTRSQRLEA
jgi:hypothetical protein